jgi:hypothetical protein
VEFIDGVHGFVKMLDRVASDKASFFTALKDVYLFNQVYLEQGKPITERQGKVRDY